MKPLTLIILVAACFMFSLRESRAGCTIEFIIPNSATSTDYEVVIRSKIKGGWFKTQGKETVTAGSRDRYLITTDFGCDVKKTYELTLRSTTTKNPASGKPEELSTFFVPGKDYARGPPGEFVYTDDTVISISDLLCIITFCREGVNCSCGGNCS